MKIYDITPKCKICARPLVKWGCNCPQHGGGTPAAVAGGQGRTGQEIREGADYLFILGWVMALVVVGLVLGLVLTAAGGAM